MSADLYARDRGLPPGRGGDVPRPVGGATHRRHCAARAPRAPSSRPPDAHVLRLVSLSRFAASRDDLRSAGRSRGAMTDARGTGTLIRRRRQPRRRGPSAVDVLRAAAPASPRPPCWSPASSPRAAPRAGGGDRATRRGSRPGDAADLRATRTSRRATTLIPNANLRRPGSSAASRSLQAGPRRTPPAATLRRRSSSGCSTARAGRRARRLPRVYRRGLVFPGLLARRSRDAVGAGGGGVRVDRGGADRASAWTKCRPKTPPPCSPARPAGRVAAGAAGASADRARRGARRSRR